MRARRPVRSAGRLRLALALLPARAREERLEVGLGGEIPWPERVLLAVPADLGDHAGGENVLAVLELDALVVDDQVLGAHVGLVRGLLQRGGFHRLRAIDDV